MTVIVTAQRKPDQPWIEYETRTVEDLGLPADADPVPLSLYGGRLDQQVDATGFFYAREIEGRWWLVDPDGCLYLHVGVVAVSPGRSETNRAALREKFGEDKTQPAHKKVPS